MIRALIILELLESELKWSKVESRAERSELKMMKILKVRLEI